MRADDLAVMPAAQALLVKQGTTFTNCITPDALCAPARASLLRGQYPRNHQVWRGRGFDGFYALGHEESTIATWLQDAGYRTGLIGKYLNAYPAGGIPAGAKPSHIPPGWDEWVGTTDDGYYRFDVNENGESKAFRKHQNQYSTDYFASKAATFITQAQATGQPFFLYLAPLAPHGPAEPADRHVGTFAGTPAPRSPSFNEADVTDKPSVVQMRPEMGASEIAAVDERYPRALETLQAVDEMITALVDQLRDAGTLEQTYIVLSADNGYHYGEHRIALEKSSPYEESIRVPLVVRGPGVLAGRTIPALASLVDLAPTFAAWGDAVVPDFVDGRSLAPLLDDNSSPTPWRHSVLIDHDANGDSSKLDPATFRALRTVDRLYAEYITGERELYDLVNDPYQLENQADDADPAFIQTLSARLAAMTTCSGETCRAIEAAPL
jgi:arylsulfatase A-like enzyme